MLMEVRKQSRVIMLSVKYALMKEMLNKVSFFSNIIFMILNNASFIIQWLIIYSIKSNISGYTLKDILLFWGLAAGVYGFSRFFFKNAFDISTLITNGKLDAFLVQPKDVLLSAITTDVSVSAIGDIIYAYIMLIVYGITFKNFIFYTLFCITGALISVSIAVIFGSFSFWIGRADLISDTANSLLVHFATYPDGIFKGFTKLILYTIVPVGITAYMPIHIISKFNIYDFLIVMVATITLCALAYVVFYNGLKKYSSSNLMISRI